MLEIGDAVMLGNRPCRVYDLVFEEARNGESDCGRSSSESCMCGI